MSTEWVTIMPNMGRIDHRLPPVGIEHLFRDPHKDLPVELLVNSDHVDAKRQRWSISWTVGSSSDGHRIHRVLQVVREVEFGHYSNWGPITRVFEPVQRKVIPIATLNLAQRKALEDIASSAEVPVPGAEWNCQDWVVEVLHRAVKGGLMATEQVDRALREARRSS